jgi:hypothetical protein
VCNAICGFRCSRALTMPRREGLLLVALVWFANQAVGFSVLHYPWTADCFAWGFAIGIIALLATLGSAWTAKRLASMQRLSSATSFLAAFAIYEGLLFFTSIIVQSGVAHYSAAVVGRIFAINAFAFIALLLTSKLGARAGLIAGRTSQLVAAARHG